jgi:hypothetical protein
VDESEESESGEGEEEFCGDDENSSIPTKDVNGGHLPSNTSSALSIPPTEVSWHELMDNLSLSS